MKEKTFVNDETARESSICFTFHPRTRLLRDHVFLNVFVRMMLKARESKHYYKIIGRPS